ncbi:hypothetical protein [Pseudogemmobacter bohemicus]|uniref:hypothetical protein n=1 Tax=Pseudogemmobacter bohemicus TaxID=2250708 RepID=UPI000DD346A1|nr:hypothetical protein [Pseudogemmobacter bohemicus]
MTGDRDPLIPRDPLDRLAELALPGPDPARLRADIARAREAFVAAGLPKARPAAGGIARWLSPLRFGLAGSTATAGVMGFFLLLPSGQMPDGSGRNGAAGDTALVGGAVPNVAETGAISESVADMAAEIAAPAPPASPVSKSASAAVPDMTLPEMPPSVAAEEASELAMIAPAAPTALPPALAPPAATAPAATPSAAGSGAPANTLPRLGARPRNDPGNAALVDLDLPEEEAEFTGSLGFSLSGDQDGIFLDREEGRLAIPIWETAPGISIQMTDVYLLPARGGFPQILMMKGKLGDQEPWQIFRVGEEAVTFDKVITDLVKEARSPGQVDAILRRLPPPD